MAAIAKLVLGAVVGVIGLRLIVGAVPAPSDVAHPAAIDGAVDWYRQQLDDWGSRRNWGPFRLGDPGLAAYACSADGRTVQLAWVWPITNDTTSMTIMVRADAMIEKGPVLVEIQDSRPAPLATSGDCSNVPSEGWDPTFEASPSE